MSKYSVTYTLLVNAESPAQASEIAQSFIDYAFEVGNEEGTLDQASNQLVCAPAPLIQYEGALSIDGFSQPVRFLAPMNASVQEQDAAFLAALAQTAIIEYAPVELSEAPELSLDEQTQGQYLIRSLSEYAQGDGNGYWSNEEGWTGLELATRFSYLESCTYSLPMSCGQDATWIHEKQVSDLATIPALPDSAIAISLDGGRTVLDAPEGARVYFKNITPGDLGAGLAELHLNVTHEGMIVDLYDTNGINLGTRAEFIDDLVADLVH